MRYLTRASEYFTMTRQSNILHVTFYSRLYIFTFIDTFIYARHRMWILLYRAAVFVACYMQTMKQRLDERFITFEISIQIPAISFGGIESYECVLSLFPDSGHKEGLRAMNIVV